MKNSKVTRRVLLLTITMIAASTFTSPVLAQAPAVDPAAVSELKRMTDFVGGLKGFKVQTDVTLEELLDNGQRIDFDVSSKVVAIRPNKIRAERVGEQDSQTFYYNGKTLTLYDPEAKAYSTRSAPPTIAEMLDYTREELGLTIPIADLVYPNAYAILMKNVNFAAIVGEVKLNGVSCTHLAFSHPDVSFQIWIARGEQPFPCKYVVTDTSTPQLLSTVTVTSDWTFDPEVSDETFDFVPPRGAQSISFLPNDDSSDN